MFLGLPVPTHARHDENMECRKELLFPARHVPCPPCRGTWGLTEWSRVVSLICGKAGDEKGRILVDGTTALSVGSNLAVHSRCH